MLKCYKCVRMPQCVCVCACRYHIAVFWFIGGVLMLVLPVAWMHKADEVSYTLLVLASMGIMGCDGE